MPSQQIPFLRAFAAALRAYPTVGGLGIDVFSGPPGDAVTPRCVALMGVEGDQEWGPLGRKVREETFSVPCSVFVKLPGADEAVIVQVQDTCESIANEIEKLLKADPSVGGVVRIAEFKAGALNQGVDTNARWCERTFRVDCSVRI